MTGLSAYAALFAAAFIAATLLPAQSEAVLVGLLVAGDHPVLALVLVAGIGNVLGATVNYVLGRAALGFQDRRWFPAGPAALARASRWYARYGRWSLLLSWAPVIGDPLTVAAGLLREPLWSFLLLVALAKFGRYTLLAAVTLQLI
ncbi:YqaA family protein [uncultured Parvibaculum sp.]|uniref:YqaA family protein n=1 Tax=uncultured Parvibaculum sp. TaxID=291828 RepID=UPI0030DA19C5|tara:strand:- start:103 stop:540 length:438 start_codon:yes stop_codon:yes gene_type:complete